MDHPLHIVAVVGGAVAGAEAAKLLAERGVGVVVFEQNARPYGKIEDGLPRWHDKLRLAEFAKIDEAFRHPLVHFVPHTRLGQSLSFEEVVHRWGFSCVILAHGAAHDRPLAIRGIDDYVGKGFYYQNQFISWYNHHLEQGYAGLRCEVSEGAIVIGGGLASIDVVKVLMLETISAALAKRGIEIDSVTLEHKGCDVVLGEQGLTIETLGVKPCTLYYRKRLQDMPLVSYKEGATESERLATEKARNTLLTRAMRKYLFRTEDTSRPIDKIVSGGKLSGLRFIRTAVEGGKMVDLPGTEFEVGAALTVSSVGSIPEPIRGIPMDGELYVWREGTMSKLHGDGGVYGLGNVVTGRGNINASRRHSKLVADHVGTTEIETFQPLSMERATELLSRVRAQQSSVGYDGNYDRWLADHPPIDRKKAE